MCWHSFEMEKVLHVITSINEKMKNDKIEGLEKLNSGSIWNDDGKKMIRSKMIIDGKIIKKIIKSHASYHAPQYYNQVAVIRHYMPTLVIALFHFHSDRHSTQPTNCLDFVDDAIMFDWSLNFRSISDQWVKQSMLTNSEMVSFQICHRTDAWLNRTFIRNQVKIKKFSFQIPTEPFRQIDPCMRIDTHQNCQQKCRYQRCDHHET